MKLKEESKGKDEDLKQVRKDTGMQKTQLKDQNHKHKEIEYHLNLRKSAGKAF